MNPSRPPSRTTPDSRRWIIVLFLLLFVLHHDFWAWADRRLVLGFLPVGLFYHALFSLAAGGLWALANHYAWPDALERWADEPAAGARETAPAPAAAQSPAIPLRTH
jgi:hypothetical protein